MRHENEKKWMTAMAAGTLAASLAACSGGTTTEGTVQADAGLKDDTTPVTIQYWHSHAEAQMEA